MKTVVICDSGLGGLNIADRIICAGTNEPMQIIFFNAILDKKIGYNDLEFYSDRVKVFDSALTGMMKFSPHKIIIACNTLSIIYRDTNFAQEPLCPVTGIVDYAIEQMSNYLKSNSTKKLAILGTKTTIESQVYQQGLKKLGFNSTAVACPGLAMAIEQNPNSPTVQQKVLEAYQKSDMPDALAFCCTHYGFISPLWQQVYGEKTILIDPNCALANSVTHGTYQPDLKIYSRAQFSKEQIEAISPLFSSKTANALVNYIYDPKLFAVPNLKEKIGS